MTIQYKSSVLPLCESLQTQLRSPPVSSLRVVPDFVTSFHPDPLRNRAILLFSSPFLRHRARYSWFGFSPCLLTRLSESSDSWPRNKSKIALFLSGSGWKLVTKSGTTLREDTGGERSWVCKDSHNGKTEDLYWIVINQSYQMDFNI